MSRQTRMILILSVVALIGVVALGTMAERYRVLVERRGTPAADRRTVEPGDVRSSLVLSEVDRFIRVRRGIESALPRDADGQPTPGGEDEVALEPLRDRLIAEAGLSPATYRRVRTAYRQWRGGSGELGNAAASLFERRRVMLEAVDLGEWESLDL